MSELRQDRTTGRWVIIAPDRRLRPGLKPLTTQAAGPPPAFDPDCPFCPGNEAMLPGILAETPCATPSHWAVRVVPNKFPALQPEAKSVVANAQHCVRAGYGFHEVIIESPRHNAGLVSMTDAEIEAAVCAYRDRSRHLLEQPGIEAVVLFRNHGPRGGASLSHPHAQIIALGLAPPTPQALAQWGGAHYRAHGGCATCAEIESERKAAARIVEETPHFLATVPFAAATPCETWILPLRHQASFSDLADPELSEFALLLRRALGRLRRAHDDPPYNFVIDSAARAQRREAYVHWRLRIMPHLATWGGFERGAGLPINPASPEHDAVALRAALTGHEVAP
jgi:UDPglucose--hexose-1-phosphate uridylyltransferase